MDMEKALYLADGYHKYPYHEWIWMDDVIPEYLCLGALYPDCEQLSSTQFTPQLSGAASMVPSHKKSCLAGCAFLCVTYKTAR